MQNLAFIANWCKIYAIGGNTYAEQAKRSHCLTKMVRITCIRKDGGYHSNPHEGITDFGWVNEETRAEGESSREQMVNFLENQNGKACVRNSVGNTAYVGVVTPMIGAKYLRTYADGTWTDNLLSLPECLG